MLLGAALLAIALLFRIRGPLMERILSDPGRTRHTHNLISAIAAGLGVLLILIGSVVWRVVG